MERNGAGDEYSNGAPVRGGGQKEGETERKGAEREPRDTTR